MAFDNFVWDRIKDYLIGDETRRFWMKIVYDDHQGKKERKHPIIRRYIGRLKCSCGPFIETLHSRVLVWLPILGLRNISSLEMFPFEVEFRIRCLMINDRPREDEVNQRYKVSKTRDGQFVDSTILYSSDRMQL